MRRGKIRQQIIGSAIELFNENGSHRMTTNHIIDRCGISPGTFYYHFNNKEEVIREIFTIIKTEFDALFMIDENDDNLVEIFHNYLKVVFNIYRSYRFFYLELSTLLDRDPALKKDYIENHSVKIERQKVFFEKLSSKGVLKRFENDDELKSLIINLWVVSDYWISYAHSTGKKIDEAAIKEGIDQTIHVLWPYLSNKIKQKLKSY